MITKKRNGHTYYLTMQPNGIWRIFGCLSDAEQPVSKAGKDLPVVRPYDA